MKKCRSEITTQRKNNNLDYLIDPIFRNINRLFVLLIKNRNDGANRDSFEKYYMSLIEIKVFNALIDNKPFFDQLVKNKQEAYEKLIKMSKNDDYTTGNLLDYLYHQNYYKFIVIDLSKLGEEDGATMFFISEKQQKTILNFSLNLLIVSE